MNIDQAVILTQERLATEGDTMADLLRRFRKYVAPALVGESEWERILDRAERLPITMSALPFGFELPLHSSRPQADFGASLASGTRSAEFFLTRARADKTDATAGAILRICEQMETGNSPLSDIVGRKLMLEYDIGSARAEQDALPGLFLRPNERPIHGANGQENDVVMVADALAACIGWEVSDAERKYLQQAYLAQPEDTRMDSFGVFPSRSRAFHLAVMGFTSQQAVCQYLEDTEWPGQTSAVHAVMTRMTDRVRLAGFGLNINVQGDGLSPMLGFTPIVKRRYTRDSRYFLDDISDWRPFLQALGQERIVHSDKLKALAGQVSKPTMLFAKSGRYVLLQGIHHIKLVIADNRLQKVKAYLFMVLSGAV